MLPWASFPKRFPIDVRFAPRNVALGCAADRCLCAPAHEAPARSGGCPLVRPVSIEVCWSFSRPSSRRSCRIAVRCPAARSVTVHRSWTRRGASGHGDRSAMPSGCRAGSRNATGSAFPLDFDHLAIAAGFNRRALCAEAFRVRDIPLVREADGSRDAVGDTAPEIARPLEREHVHHGAEGFRFRVLPPASLPSGS
jgi:hypothetical protein